MGFARFYKSSAIDASLFAGAMLLKASLQSSKKVGGWGGAASLMCKLRSHAEHSNQNTKIPREFDLRVTRVFLVHAAASSRPLVGLLFLPESRESFVAPCVTIGPPSTSTRPRLPTENIRTSDHCTLRDMRIC